MQNKNLITTISAGFLTLMLLIAPQLSYADWGIGLRVGGPGPSYYHDTNHFYRWHDHPQWGWHFHFLPARYVTVRVGWHQYYYADGLYYNYVNGDYVLVAPPVGAYVSIIPPDFQPVIINGRTYYTDNGVYYRLTRHHGYKVVVAPVIVAQPAVVVQPTSVPVVQPAAVVVEGSFPVNVPNNGGGYTTVVIKRSGNGYVGPQGEFYASFPAVAQLKAMYGK